MFAHRYWWMCNQTKQLHKGSNVCQHTWWFPVSPCGVPKNPSCNICQNITHVSIHFTFWHSTCLVCQLVNSQISFFTPTVAVNATPVRWTTGHVPRPQTRSPTITWPSCPTFQLHVSCSGSQLCVRSVIRSVSPCSGESKLAATSQSSVQTVWQVSWCWSVLCRDLPHWRQRWRWLSWRGEPSWEDISPK